ncbi:unnamed protein product [Blepharisma stoltei]|uniref:Uncharacterized protein n=1 Tax=Blepharisma stoltei TaxID=1481888 RepID=A0AAU9JJT1_9CILI|nr:unnamed protein product [Blepharisma stoltei]
MKPIIVSGDLMKIFKFWKLWRIFVSSDKNWRRNTGFGENVQILTWCQFNWLPQSGSDIGKRVKKPKIREREELEQNWSKKLGKSSSRNLRNEIG